MAYSKKETTTKHVSEWFVKPKYEIESTNQFYHLGPVDVAMLDIDPIQKGLLYSLDSPKPQTNAVSNLLHRLKDSLAIALVYFYPLAGRFVTQKYPEENASSIIIDCNKDPGARLIHAKNSELTLSDILSPVDVTNVHSFFDLGERYVNYDGHTKALLCIQVTELVDGVFIGFSINHSVVDGTSFIHFINMLSEIFTSCGNGNGNGNTSTITSISRVPILNYRPWLSDDHGDNAEALKFPFPDPEKFICRGHNPGPLRERIFQFSSTSLAKLKAKANQECETQNEISSFQSLIAHVWRGLARARSTPLDQQTAFSMAVGARRRFDPPLTEAYFGNFLRRAQWACKVEELLGHGLGWTAKNLNQVIMAQDGNQVLRSLKEGAKSPFIIPRGPEPDPNAANNISVGGSGRFNMYGPEFGLGRALGCRMGYGNKADGKVTANPGCEGGGSIDLEMCLRPHAMDALETDQEFMSYVSFNN